jgi:hypothetical protein
VGRAYAAAYLVKCHAVAFAQGVQRIYVYNYQNRGNDIHFAEHHFGLRAYAEEGPGCPLPAYVAYARMLDLLGNRRVRPVPSAASGLSVFEALPEHGREHVLLVWSNSGKRVDVPWSALRNGMQAADVAAMEDLFGTPRRVRRVGLTVDDAPCWVTLK